MSSKTQPPAVAVRRATAADAAVAGKICYDAFYAISTAHGFPCDLPSPEAAVGLLSMLFSAPGYFAVVAESDGRVVGSNVLAEDAVIHGIGPITISTDMQNAGVGRRLMQAVMDRSRESGGVGIRLVQAAFHNRSLSLYASLGFDIREPLSCMQGQTRERSIPGCTVRAAQVADASACNALAMRVHGFDRAAELVQAIKEGAACVVEREGRVTGYSTSLGFFGHTTAETNMDMKALIASAETFTGPGILVPSRNNDLLRWCLANGLRIVEPMTLMSTGLYTEPAGAWMPSIVF